MNLEKLILCAIAAGFLTLAQVAAIPRSAHAQSSVQNAKLSAASPGTQSVPKQSETKSPQLPAEIVLLETRVRFEANGDSRKEVHARVKINNELGVRQFARLTFDYNRAFQQIEFPLVRVTHASGGTADILPSAITDAPNPAVANAPAYQDVRQKSVRILGLAPGDSLEYQVVTTTAHHPLAPDFWTSHTFDRTGVVANENFEIDAPVQERVQTRFAPNLPAASIEKQGSGESARAIYRWKISHADKSVAKNGSADAQADVQLTTFPSWTYLAAKLYALLAPASGADQEVSTKAGELTRGTTNQEEKLEAIYQFVSQQISTIDIPLGSTGFHTQTPAQVLAGHSATAEDKCALFLALASAAGNGTQIYLAHSQTETKSELPSPTSLTHLFLASGDGKRFDWLDPSLEVAPFGMIPAEFRGKDALWVKDWLAEAAKHPLEDIAYNPWRTVPDKLPFPATQAVGVDAVLATDGRLSAKVRYTMRGDNELLLRVAFHQTPKEKWKDVAQLLALSDGFRGQIKNVTASDPFATKEPFTVEYEIEQPKFVDWSKKPVRIPALLPALGLPDPPSPGANNSAEIDLGTPLEVGLTGTLHLPPGTTAQTPTGASVARDYAEFSSKYGIENGKTPGEGISLTASRRLKFISRTLPAARFADYNAFYRTVQSDQTQDFTLTRSEASSKPAPAKP